MSERLKIFLACAIGAGIGTLASLHLAGLFVFLGFMTGAVCGYLLYEPMTVIMAIPAAWRLAVASVRWLVERRQHFGAYISSTIGMFGFVVGLALLIGGTTQFELWSCVITSIIGATMLHVMMDNETTRNEYLLVFGSPLKFTFFYLPYALFIAARVVFWPLFIVMKYSVLLVMSTPFVISYGGIYLCGWYLPRLIRDVGLVVGRFLYHVFVMIHSERRFLCLVDAGLGSLVGFYAGSVLIGMIAGAAFGLLNYEIVSLRILGLQPVKK
jgi:hypothetical protein